MKPITLLAVALPLAGQGLVYRDALGAETTLKVSRGLYLDLPNKRLRTMTWAGLYNPLPGTLWVTGATGEAQPVGLDAGSLMLIDDPARPGRKLLSVIPSVVQIDGTQVGEPRRAINIITGRKVVPIGSDSGITTQIQINSVDLTRLVADTLRNFSGSTILLAYVPELPTLVSTSVYVNGLLLSEGDHYTISIDTITLKAAVTGALVQVRYLTGVL